MPTHFKWLWTDQHGISAAVTALVLCSTLARKLTPMQTEMLMNHQSPAETLCTRCIERMLRPSDEACSGKSGVKS
jgi:hypothetical protein